MLGMTLKRRRGDPYTCTPLAAVSMNGSSVSIAAVTYGTVVSLTLYYGQIDDEGGGAQTHALA